MNRNARPSILAMVMLCGFLLVACLNNPTQPNQLPLGQAFDLRVGASAALRGGLTISFDGVQSDSRCPMDALCVWAGDAVVVVSLSQAARARDQRELHTDPSGSKVSYLAYSITLVALAPYPRSDRQTRPEDYVATFIVTAR
jgi:hypothetical protein